MTKSIDKILVIRLSSIGDILLSTPIFRALRAQFPDAEIDVLVKTHFVELLRFNPHISSVLEIGAAGSKDLIQVTRQIRSERYDLIIDLHNSLRSRIIRWFSGAPEIRVVDKRVRERFILVNAGKNLYGKPVSVTDRYFETVADFAVVNDGDPLEIHVPQALHDEVNGQLTDMGIRAHGPVIALAPAARHETKMWPADRFEALAVEVSRKYHAQIVVLGGKDDRLYCENIVRSVTEHLGVDMVFNLAGSFSLLGTAVVLDRCSILVSNDSGLMHLAAARKKPVVAIFGPTVEEFGFFPYGTRSIVVEQEGLPCRPCSHLGGERCPKRHFRCMLDTPVGQVAQEIAALLPHQPHPAQTH